MQATRTFGLLLCLSVLTFVLLLPSLVGAGVQQITSEELLQKHLASIGTAEARAAVRNRFVQGDTDVVFRLGGNGQLSGKGNLVSQGAMIRLAMVFNGLDYPGELFGFDGKKVTVSQIRQGVRPRFGSLIYTYDALLKEGLIGGTISTSWPLLDMAHHQPNLQYTGLKKIDGKQLHELQYEIMKGGTGLRVALYFDPENFRHVRSQYKVSQDVRLMDPSVNSADSLGGDSPRESLLVETFDNFKEVDGLTLPHAYKIILQRGGYLAEWNFAVTQVLHNQKIDPKWFVVQ
jgi:hypothetical protein